MSLNAKDAIVEIMSDGVGRTTPQLVDELLRLDRALSMRQNTAVMPIPQ